MYLLTEQNQPLMLVNHQKQQSNLGITVFKFLGISSNISAVLYPIGALQAFNVARHPTKYDVIDDAKLVPAVYRRIYCRKFLTVSK